MIRTQIQLPDPLYQRLKVIAEQHPETDAIFQRSGS